MKPRPGSLSRLSTPVKAWLQRFTLFALLAAGLGLMMMDSSDLVSISAMRRAVSDATAPILDMLSRPAETVNQAIETVQGVFDVQGENIRLREENASLRQWETVARRLDAENQGLRALLKFAPDPRASFISARIIGDNGGAFVRSVLINAGADLGVRRDQAAMTGEGLVGRVVEVGQRAARILLITDINSRIPVLVERTRDQAILAGDNTSSPQLIYLPPRAEVKPGDRIVTSGYGGVFPPGLPVGMVVSAADNGAVRIQPLVVWNRLEFVRLIDYENAGLTSLSPAPAHPGAKESAARPGESR